MKAISGVSFAEATTIPVQGLSAHTLLNLAAKPQPSESVLIQAAAGGVGLFQESTTLARYFSYRLTERRACRLELNQPSPSLAPTPKVG
jgi:hypothetical protein